VTLAEFLLSRGPMKHTSSKLATVGVILALCGAAAMANDDDDAPKKGVPPGLAKKGGLPPGQAKKQGYGQTQTANPSTPPTVQARETAPAPNTPAAPATPGAPAPTTPIQPANTTPTPTTPTTTQPPSADPNLSDSVKVGKEVQARRAKVESQVAEIDGFGNTAEARERIFTRLHRNSNIPVSTLEAQRKAYPDVGLGGITVANYISKGNPKVSALQVLAEHKSTGKGWGEIAQGHGVHLTELIDWLAEAKAAARQADTSGRLKGL
jgi:hypothetical protein